jgi:high-affinity nickel-transport protein
MDLVATFSKGGFGLGILVTAFWFGFRHGIDWDHIAAITDITSSQEDRRPALLYGTLYALGHALVVMALGILAIVAGERLPDSFDNTMTRIVGVTLLLLGVYVFYSLIRHGRDFRMRSRWMLVFAGVRRGVRWARQRVRAGAENGNEPAAAIDADEEGLDAAYWHHGHHGRPGHHHHERPEPDDTFVNYSRATAFGVGMIHGVGAETPTQVLLFLSAAGVGRGLGVLVLVAFIVGLLASNSTITLGSSYGFLTASKNFPLYATVAVLTGVFSLLIGAIFVTGRTTLLPALFGG